MQKFLINTVILLLLSLVTVSLIVIATAYYCKQNFDYKLPKEKNTLVLGNSHPESAIDDGMLPNVYNFAQSGSAYFYDYLKVREFVSRNSQIDTVVIGYSYDDLTKEKDSWFVDEEKIRYKLRNHFFLFSPKDYFSLLKSNPVAVISQTPQTIYYSLLTNKLGLQMLGGYKYLERDKLAQAKEMIKNEAKPSYALEYSRYQSKYLLNIYEYCQSKNIKLILLNVPVHPILADYQSSYKTSYCDFAAQKMPNAVLVNHANFKVPENCYADMDHLNYKGAKLYTEFLKTNKFKIGVQKCFD